MAVLLQCGEALHHLLEQVCGHPQLCLVQLQHRPTMPARRWLGRYVYVPHVLGEHGVEVPADPQDLEAVRSAEGAQARRATLATHLICRNH